MLATELTPEEHINALCEWVSSGKTLRKYARANGLPPWKLYYWMADNETLSQRFSRAKLEGTHTLMDATLAIADTKPQDAVEATWQRTRIDAYQKAIARWNPREYGDKVQHEVTGCVLQVVTGLPNAANTASLTMQARSLLELDEIGQATDVPARLVAPAEPRRAPSPLLD